MNYVYDDVLEHHGILGQKWGTQNGPPYPLKAGDHSYAERVAAREERKDKKVKAANERAKVKATSKQRELERSRIRTETANIKKNTKLAKSRFEAEQKRKEEELKAAEREARFLKNKSKIIRTGNIQQASKYVDLFTVDELTAIITKYEKATKVKDLANKAAKKTSVNDILKSFGQGYKEIAGMVGTTAEAYAKVQKAMNNIPDGSKQKD